MSSGELVPSTGYLIWHLSMKWRASLDRALAPLGLTAAQYSALASLHGLSAGGTRPSQRELADFAGLEPMYISKLVRVLEQNGLVKRTLNPADSRAVQLSLTESGLAAVAKGRAEVVRLEEERLAPLGGRSSRQVADLQEILITLLRHSDRAAEPNGG